MFESTRYGLSITASHGYDMRGRKTVDFAFQVNQDDVVVRSGVASSPAALGTAIGDACRDMAERYERAVR